MTHPPVEELLGGGEAAREHLDACPACRRVVSLADDPTAPRAPEAADTFPTDAIDRGRYTDWTAVGGGGGGMGHIFRAFDARLGREVVIKQPRSRALRARFEREALLTARLQHPAIVGVYEAGRFGDGEPFYAMPHVRGAPLSDEIARRKTPEERVGLVPYVTAVCEAVAYAHDQGIVHRDLKPANVLIGSFGETVVIDWGLATDLAARDHAPASVSLDDVGDGLTQLGVGTPNYMPPEQALGTAADPRMDVYALGATLYHALAGSPPYDTVDTAHVRSRLVAEPPVALAEIAPWVAPALCDIVARAMAREPSARFASARELAEELRRFQSGRLVLTRRYTPGELVRHYARRYRAPLSVAAVAAALLAGVGVVSAVRVTRAGNAAKAAQRRAEANERASQTELRRGMGVTASRLALVPERRAEALALAVGAVAPALAANQPLVDEARQGLLDAIAGTPVVVLAGHTAPIGSFAFSPDGARVAGHSPGDHSIQLWDARSGRHLSTVAAGGAHFAVDELAFSPDGTRLLTWARAPAQAQLWPIGVDTPPSTLDISGTLAGAAFFADGTLVLAGDDLTYLDKNGALIRHVEMWAPVAALASSPDRIAIMRRGMVELYNAKGQFVAKMRTGVVYAIALSPDGKYLAMLDAAGVSIHEIGVETPRVVALPASTPSEARLAFTASGWLLVDRGGGQPTVAIDKDGSVSPVASSATAIDGDRVWSGQPGHVDLVDLASHAPVRTLDGPAGLGVNAIAIGPGARLAVATESAAWLVDARGGNAGMLVGHASEVTGVATVGSRVISAGLDGRVLAWDADGASTGSARIESEVAMVAVAGERVVVGGVDGRAQLVMLDGAGALVAHPPIVPPGTAIAALAVTADGQRMALARTDGELLVVDPNGIQDDAVRLRDAGAPAIAALAFQSDASGASLLATVDVQGRVELWDAAQNKRVAEHVLPTVDDIDRSLFSVEVAGSSRLLVSRYGGDTIELALPTLAESATLVGRVVASSRDGARVVTVGPVGEIDVHDGRAAGHRVATVVRPLTTAALSPDATSLALGDADGVVRIIDLAATGVRPLEIASAGGAVSALRFTVDGRHVVAGYASGALRLHPVKPADALARACRTLSFVGRTERGCVTSP